MPEPAVAIVGTGQAGFQAAASLRQEGFAGRIVLIGDEPVPPYQRPPLSKSYLARESGLDELWLRPETFYTQHRIEVLAGESVASIDRTERRLQLASGGKLAWDHLVLATGARCRPLPVPGAELDGVLPLRTLADADILRERLDQVRDIVVIGAGFIGLEFASVAIARGAAVHIIEVTQHPMGRVVSATISKFFCEAHRRWGAEVSLGTGVTRVLGAGGRVSGVETTDGRHLPTDLVLICIGVIPNAELAGEAGLAVDNGIVVDEYLATEDAAIFAIGDCANFPTPFAIGRVRLESVQNAVDQGRCVAANIAGKPAPYDKVPWFWSDQGDLKLQIAGITAGHDTAVLRGDPDSGHFSVFCYRAGRLIGVESVNQTADHVVARRLLTGEPKLKLEQAADLSYDLRAHARSLPAR
jgi:3-phenylpropionate/trans-cinnamate dioxygenase ferredoxin reductase component